MPKTTSDKPKKRTPNTKSTTKLDKPDKPKREPSAYNLFCKKHMKEWIAANPGRAKEAMAHIALLWKDAPENPNRGKRPRAKRTKASPHSGSSDPPSSDD